MSERHDSLALLSPVMRAMAVEFIARLVEHKVHFLIVETWRTHKRQEELLGSGHSWTSNSKHIKVNGTVPAAEAIDLAPYEVYRISGADKLLWDSDHRIWKLMGPIGETVGLTWGGRWGVRDMCHWELPDG